MERPEQMTGRSLIGRPAVSEGQKTETASA